MKKNKKIEVPAAGCKVAHITKEGLNDLRSSVIRMEEEFQELRYLAFENLQNMRKSRP